MHYSEPANGTITAPTAESVAPYVPTTSAGASPKASYSGSVPPTRVPDDCAPRAAGGVRAHPYLAGIQRRHGASVEQVVSDLAAIRSLAMVVNPAVVPAVMAAVPDDDMVLACAVSGSADCIVTGDPHLLDLGEYRGIRIVRPAQFASILADA